mmetsp:Transcript_3238/g.9515  ORF Transcript_3238/g.9515 Transcript_3238/m.9515 type:complete len:214 (-) Transcript_3238:103-744(-)
MPSLALVALLVASRCAALLPNRASARRVAASRAGFGAAEKTQKKKKKAFVKPGKKDLEKQWEQFVLHQRKSSNLFRCESVWARTDGAWERVGAVVTKSDEAGSNAQAVAAQKKLIAWTTAELFPALNKKGAQLEYGLGPYVDDDDDASDGGDASKVAALGKVEAPGGVLPRRASRGPPSTRRTRRARPTSRTAASSPSARPSRSTRRPWAPRC